MCERFGALPVPGGVYAQPADMIRMLKIVHMARTEDSA